MPVTGMISLSSAILKLPNCLYQRQRRIKQYLYQINLSSQQPGRMYKMLSPNTKRSLTQETKGHGRKARKEFGMLTMKYRNKNWKAS